MTQLEDDLAELARTVPHLAGEIAQALDQAAVMEHEIDELARETRSQAQRTQAMAKQPLAPNADLARLFHRFDGTLQTALAEMEAKWEAAHAELDPARDAVKAAADRLQASAAALGQTTVEMKTSVDEGSHAGQATVDAMERLSHDSHERLHTAAASVTDDVATLRTLLEHVRQSMADSAQAVLARATQLSEEATQHGKDLVEDLEHRRDSLRDHDQTVAEQTLDGVEQLLEDGLTPRLDAAVHHGIQEPGTAVQHQLEALARAAGEAGTAVDHGRQTWKDAVGRLESTAEPIPHAVQEIHEAAERMRHQ
jgi:chromosome segregation ATPase